MRDPRLLEIAFLMDLDQLGVLTVRTTSYSETSGVFLGDQRRGYGVDPHRFRDLLVGLALQQYITLPRIDGDGSYTPGRDARLAGVLSAGVHSIEVVITHRGRVRLWDLRDELLRDPEIEPMGLRNKAAWERDLELRLRWATVNGPLSIIFLDLDSFGAVNKELGVTVGDDVLRATFGLAKNLVGGRGQVYRFGGEEVGILLPATRLDAARAFAEELRSTIETEVRSQVPALQRAQTASLGVAEFTAAVEPRVAVERVDALMRAAKKQGKNRVVLDDTASGAPVA